MSAASLYLCLRALDRSAEWGKDEQDQEALAAQKAFLLVLRAEVAPFNGVPPTPNQRAAVGVHASVPASTAG